MSHHRLPTSFSLLPPPLAVTVIKRIFSVPRLRHLYLNCGPPSDDIPFTFEPAHDNCPRISGRTFYQIVAAEARRTGVRVLLYFRDESVGVLTLMMDLALDV